MQVSLSENRPIFIFEHESKDLVLSKKEEEIIRTDLKTFFELKFSRKISKDEYLCHIRAKHYFGILKISDRLKIVIQPKIRSINFLEMLLYVEPKYAIIYNDLVKNLKAEENFLQILLTSFLENTEILLLYSRRKDYVSSSSISNTPCGKINILKSLRFQNGTLPKFWRKEYKFSGDTAHNQIIRYTLEYIRNAIPDDLISVYRRVLSYLDETSLRVWTVTEIERINYDRLNYNYKNIHLLCILILQEFTIKMAEGEKKYFSFVLNTWSVYEAFLRKIFKQFQQIFKVEAYKTLNLSQDVDWDNKGRPDIILSSEKEGIIIIDAKYKLNFQRSDENQMYRYLGEYNTNTGYLIYPKSENLQKGKKVPIIQREEEGMINYMLIDLSKISDQAYLKKFVSNIVDI